MREHEFEPVPGLPEVLPDGEHIVWQGAPKPAALINRVFQVRTLGFYFTLLIAAGVIYEVLNGARWADIVTTLGWQMGLAAVALGLLTGAGHLYARSTLYTLTNRRLVLRSGVALPMMVNLPLDHVKSAGLRLFGDGTGDILFTPDNGARLYYLMLWPHVRLLGFGNVQPLLRGIADPQHVAKLLARVVKQAGGGRHVEVAEAGLDNSSRDRGEPSYGNDGTIAIS
jgi:hypothetical protein